MPAVPFGFRVNWVTFWGIHHKSCDSATDRIQPRVYPISIVFGHQGRSESLNAVMGRANPCVSKCFVIGYQEKIVMTSMKERCLVLERIEKADKQTCQTP